MAQKVDNPQDVTAEVEVAISKTEQFVENNKKKMLYGALAIIVVVCICSLWNWYNNSQNAKAQEEIYTAQFLFDNANYQEALATFEEVADNYGSTVTGNLATAYAGLCNKELGNYDEAIKQLESYSGSDVVIAPAVQSAIGDCYVAQENYSKAVKYFEKAASAANNETFSPIYLKKAGLAYEAMSDKASALKTYTKIQQNWLNTEIGQSIDKYIYRVQ